MFRRKPVVPPPPWRDRFDRARRLIIAQSPPPWMVDRIDALDTMLLDGEADHARLGAAIGELDLDSATAELKAAMRTGRDAQLIAALQSRYESIHDLINKQSAIRRSIERALVDVDVLAARSVELGARADRWQLDETVDRLRIEMTALEQAHRELADL